MEQSIALKEEKTGVRNAKKWDANPFLVPLIIKTKNKKMTVAKGATIVDLDTGEIEGRTEIQQIIEVDEGQFIKLFTKDLSIWFDLNKSSLRVFGALLATVQNSAIGRDLVFFDYGEKATKEFKMSKQTFYRGIDELITKSFIARHKSPGWYYINPAMFFNGNRARFVKEYRVTERKQASLFNEPNEPLDVLPAPQLEG